MVLYPGHGLDVENSSRPAANYDSGVLSTPRGPPVLAASTMPICIDRAGERRDTLRRHAPSRRTGTNWKVSAGRLRQQGATTSPNLSLRTDSHGVPSAV